MAEVNASITQLFKDKLKPGQIAQTPVYPKTIGEAVEVSPWKGASSSNKETVNQSLHKKIGWQCHLLCPNGWWYLYSFDSKNNFTLWVADVTAAYEDKNHNTNTTNILQITDIDSWGDFEQDNLEEIDNSYKSKGLLQATPLRYYTENSDNPDTPEPPEPPTPVVVDLRVKEFELYDDVEDGVSNIYSNVASFTLTGQNIEGRVRITVSPIDSNATINFVPYLDALTVFEEDANLVYPNILLLDGANIDALNSNAGITIYLHRINDLEDSANIVTIECLDTEEVSTKYFVINHPVTESTIIAPDEISNLPISIDLNNKEDSYEKVFSFQTQNAVDDITISVLPAQVNGDNVNFYAYFRSRKTNKIIETGSAQNPSVTITADVANAGVSIQVLSAPTLDGPFTTVNTTQNNYGKVQVTGIGNSTHIIANLYYTYAPDETHNSLVSVNTSDIYLNMTDSDTTISGYSSYGGASPTFTYDYSFIEGDTDVEFKNFSSLISSGVNTNIPAIHVKITVRNFAQPYNMDTFIIARIFKKENDSYSIPLNGNSTLFNLGLIRKRVIDNVLQSTSEWVHSKDITAPSLKIAANSTFSEGVLEFYVPLYGVGNLDSTNRPNYNSFLLPTLYNNELYIGIEHTTVSNGSPTMQDINNGFISILDNNKLFIPIHIGAKPEQDNNSRFIATALYDSTNSNCVTSLSDTGVADNQKLNITQLPAYFMHGITEDSSSTFSTLDLSGYTNLKTIGEYAFAECSNLSEATLPNSVTSIGAGAFKGCENLELINIPTNMKAIKPETFYNTQVVTDSLLQAIVVPNKVTTLGKRAFANNTNVGRVTIPASITSIGDECFINCTNLATVTFNGESNLKTLGRSVFANCSSLLSIAIPNGVTVLEAGTFSGCSSLTTVDLGTGIGVLPGTGLFNGCVAMTDLYLRFTTEVEGSPVGVVWPMPIGGTRFTFEDEVKENPNFTIHVPSEVLEWYQNNEFWLAQVNDDSSRIVAIDE